MARLEGRDHGINALLGGPGEHQGLLGRGITQGQADPDLRRPRIGISAIPLAIQHLLCFCHQPLHLIRQVRQQIRREGSAEMHLPPAALAGLTHAEGGENAGHGMQQHRVQPQFIRQATGVLTTSPSVGHQHPAANVLTAMQRHPANGSSHGFHRQLQRPGCHPLRGLPQRCRELREAMPHHLHIRWQIPGRSEHRREAVHLQTPQQQVGVGDGERSAGAVTGRARLRSGGAGPHPQPLPLELQHGSATGRHGFNRQTWGQQLQAGDLGLLLHLPQSLRIGASHTEHIRRRSPHVEAEHRHPVKAGHPRRGDRPNHPRRRPRKDGVFGLQPVWSLQRSAGGHHPQGRGGTQRPLHLLQVAIQHRMHGPLHQGRLPPRHQAGHHTHLVGADHGAKAKFPQQCSTALLMGWVALGMQQRHHGDVQAGTAQLLKTPPQRLIQHQGLHLLTPGIEPTGQLQHRLRQEGALGLLEREQIIAMLIADPQLIPQPGIGEQQQRSTSPLQQRIGGHGGAETHVVDVPQIHGR